MLKKYFTIDTVGGKRQMPSALQNIDQALYVRLTKHHSPLGDLVLPKVSQAANGSRLWMGTAAVLAVAGGKRGRSAAVQGLAALAITSLIVNGPVKLLVRRRRPDSALVPPLRRLKNVLVTSSFPSGHSASAAAFAVGAGLAMPEVAVPLGLVAGAVGFSRVYTGAHFPSDVLAGFAVGATAASTVHGAAVKRKAIRDALLAAAQKTIAPAKR